MDHGVSVQFFAAAGKLLEKQYGPRICENVALNEFAARLGDAERAFLKLPKADKPSKRKP